MKIIDLMQGTQAWHDFRKKTVGSSDAPIVLNISPYKTPRELWLEKTDGAIIADEKKDDSKEFIFSKGHDVEKKIRKDYFEYTGFEMNPVVIIHPKIPYLSASLDGYHPAKGILEAKLVGNEYLGNVKKGSIKPDHFAQMQHQMMCADDIDLVDYFCHNGKDNGVLISVKKDNEFIKKMEDIEHEFHRLVTERIIPAMTARDYLVPTMAEEIKLFEELRDTKELADNAKIKFETLKEKILEKYTHPKIYCAGVKIIETESEGRVDYKKIPEIANVDLEKYRGKKIKSWRVLISNKEPM